jgi:hypothetical protein
MSRLRVLSTEVAEVIFWLARRSDGEEVFTTVGANDDLT